MSEPEPNSDPPPPIDSKNPTDVSNFQSQQSVKFTPSNLADGNGTGAFPQDGAFKDQRRQDCCGCSKKFCCICWLIVLVLLIIFIVAVSTALAVCGLPWAGLSSPDGEQTNEFPVMCYTGYRPCWGGMKSRACKACLTKDTNCQEFEMSCGEPSPEHSSGCLVTNNGHKVVCLCDGDYCNSQRRPIADGSDCVGTLCPKNNVTESCNRGVGVGGGSAGNILLIILFISAFSLNNKYFDFQCK